MKFFVDTADISEIRELSATGFLDGVTADWQDRPADPGRDRGDLQDCRGAGLGGSHCH